MQLKNNTKFTLKANTEDAETPEDISIEWLLSGIDMERRRIELRSEINELSASVIIRAVIRMSELSSDPIEIILSSPGGDVIQGLAIYDVLRSSPCDIKIVANGQIMSMGFIIFLAGDERSASQHSVFMMHSIAYGSDAHKIVRHHEIDVNEAKRQNNVLLEIMATRTNRNKKYWYRTVILSDKYFNVAEAKDLGIINEKPVNKPVKRKTVKKVRRNVTKKT